MKIKTMDPAQAKDFSAFILPDVMDEEGFEEYLFYVAIEDKTPCGILVMAPRKFEPQIKSIAVSPKYKGHGIATLLLKYAIYDYMTLVEDPEAPNHFRAGFTISGKNEKAITRVFEKAGFSLDEQGEFYVTQLNTLRKSEMLTSSRIKKQLKSRDIASLRETPHSMLTPFLDSLAENEQLPLINPNTLEEDLSVFGIRDDAIVSCILFRVGDDGMLYNEYVYRDSEKCAKGEIGYLFAASLKAALKKYDRSTTVTFLATSPSVEALLKKAIPNYMKLDKYLLFQRSFDIIRFDADELEEEEPEADAAEPNYNEDKANEQLAFNLLEEKNMKCANCRYCINKIIECQKYIQKPDAVLDGENCPMFEAKDE